MKRQLFRRALVSAMTVYVAVSILGAAVLSEVALHPPRRDVELQAYVPSIAQRDFGPSVRDAEVTTTDGARLKGWLVSPARSNGNIVIVLHGVADNREG